ncbi:MULTISPECIES: hypothetical protein [Laceyella]|uniref:Uncharacterized protein n=1 Tax=Laceyella sacchari TaxID=37482 RepID=A0ABY5U1Y8_LACSH|nr:hypothetical protein [Laceyella sacchari]KPC76769.1 hypothetical protein ADL26_05090 [Thermoactinomyces vulgaris]MRG29436.1 hypothetical protein [Laceyella tengchongensis]UWE03674.1 hypothetical protein NYR52_00120 [Laceyella sacchari]
MKRIWRNKLSLGSIYVELDKSKTSALDLTHKVFTAAESFGFVSFVEVVTESAGDEAYVEVLNPQGVRTWEPIDQISVTTKKPTNGLISYLETNHDIRTIRFYLGTACYDELSRKILLRDAAGVSLYVDYDEDDWGLYININTDIFVPFFGGRDERTEEMARRNTPIFKRFIKDFLALLPVTSWEWEEATPHMREYLELN